ncbi:hypothetical protein L579_1404 [Pantoea sp. AS-PWVM4]|nr:hypothetical protein L579_1404 [Pantoea sp. AS-PWVM4]
MSVVTNIIEKPQNIGIFAMTTFHISVPTEALRSAGPKLTPS